MLPLLVALWQSDTTLRAALEPQFQTTVLGSPAAGLLFGGELTLDGRALGAGSAYDFRASGRYAHLFSVAPASAAGPGTGNLAFSLGGGAGYQLSPLTYLTLDTRGSIASRFGVRALDGPVQIDPFLSGNRIVYGVGGGATLSVVPSRRDTLRFVTGYQQDGGLSADVPEAVGVDAHAGRAEASWRRELGPADTIVPELRLALTRYEHALYDVALHRGRADVRAGTAAIGLTHTFTKRIEGAASLGLTLASVTIPPPRASSELVASPDARASLTWLGHRYRVAASYGFAFTSLGARLTYGRQHSALAELSLMPFAGARYRDLVLHATARFAYGTAEVALPMEPGATGPVLEGRITTTSLATGALVEVPLARGVAFTGGGDLQLGRGVITPAPASGQSGTQLGALVMLGIAWTLSTDPARLVRPDPEREDEEARAKVRAGEAVERSEERGRAAPGEGSIDSERESAEP